MKNNKEQLLDEITETENKLMVMRKLVADIDKKKSPAECTTWEEICQVSGRDPNKLPDMNMYDDEDKKYALAAFKLPIIYKVRNEGWKADYDNKRQEKWTPIHQKVSSGRSSGFVYSLSNFEYGIAYARLGSRFASPTKEKSASAAQDFSELWNDFLLYNS